MYTTDDLKNLSEEDKKRQRRNIQVQVIMLESDSRKLQTEKNRLDAEIRNLKMDIERLRISLEQKTKMLEKATYQITENESERTKLKKRLNFL